MAQTTSAEHGRHANEVVSTFYWPHWSEFSEDGVFKIKTSWYTQATHATGFTKAAPEEPDYKLWQWIIQRCEAGATKLDDIVSDEMLDNFRVEFAA